MEISQSTTPLNLPDGYKPFKAFIRVVKSLSATHLFDTVTVIREPLIIAQDKGEVKSILLEKYPQFFQHNKVYEKETKDQAQFFYVVIFPLYNHEINAINEGEWACASCGQVHENKYISKPKRDERLFGGDILFCRSEDNACYEDYKRLKFQHVDLGDNINFITKSSPTYIYKCTEKLTGKSYIGKTRNAPFFRWWAHLTQSSNSFGLYLRQTPLSAWTFEVLEELPPEVSDTDVFRIESEYIKKYNSINNGFNSVMSSADISNNPFVDPDQLPISFTT